MNISNSKEKAVKEKKPSSFKTAAAFLTVFPLDQSSISKKPVQGAPYFPLIGFLISAAAAGSLYWLNLVLPRTMSAAFTVLLLLFLTGGIHLDGFADTAEGFLGAHKREKALEIMKDPALGVFGSAAVFFNLFLKTFALAGLPDYAQIPGIVTAVTGARFTMLLAAFLFPYGKREGTGKAFEAVTLTDLLKGFAFMAFLLWFIIAPLKDPVPFVASLTASVVFTMFMVKGICEKLGGLTGDVYGFSSEMTEIITLCGLMVTTGIIAAFA